MPKQDAKWNKRLEELRLFKEVHGREVEVAQRDTKWPGLGGWCNKQARRSSLARQLTHRAGLVDGA